jgi:hypothetical protein
VFLAYGTTARVSRLVGAGRRGEGLARGVDGMYLAFALGALLAVLGAVCAGPIVRWLGAGAEAAPYAESYLRVSALGLPGMLVVLAATGLLRGLHDMRTPLLVAIAAAVVNTLANWVLVYPLGLGIAGSAGGTAGVQTAMAAVYGYAAWRACRGAGVAVRPGPRAIRTSLSAKPRAVRAHDRVARVPAGGGVGRGHDGHGGAGRAHDRGAGVGRAGVGRARARGRAHGPGAGGGRADEPVGAGVRGGHRVASRGAEPGAAGGVHLG